MPTTFFSIGGRSPRLRLALVLAAAWGVGRLCGPAWEGENLLLFAAAGFVWGTALAKAVAEGARRLHDVGAGARVGALALGVWALASGAAHVLAIARDGPWVAITDVAALAALAVLLVWPGERGTNRFGQPARTPWLTSAPPQGGRDRSSWLLPLLTVGGTEAVLLTVALISRGIYDNNQRNLHWVQQQEAEHRRELERDKAGRRP